MSIHTIDVCPPHHFLWSSMMLSPMVIHHDDLMAVFYCDLCTISIYSLTIVIYMLWSNQALFVLPWTFKFKFVHPGYQGEEGTTFDLPWDSLLSVQNKSGSWSVLGCTSVISLVDGNCHRLPTWAEWNESEDNVPAHLHLFIVFVNSGSLLWLTGTAAYPSIVVRTVAVNMPKLGSIAIDEKNLMTAFVPYKDRKSLLNCSIWIGRLIQSPRYFHQRHHSQKNISWLLCVNVFHHSNESMTRPDTCRR